MVYIQIKPYLCYFYFLRCVCLWMSILTLFLHLQHWTNNSYRFCFVLFLAAGSFFVESCVGIWTSGEELSISGHCIKQKLDVNSNKSFSGLGTMHIISWIWCRSVILNSVRTFRDIYIFYVKSRWSSQHSVCASCSCLCQDELIVMIMLEHLTAQAS